MESDLAQQNTAASRWQPTPLPSRFAVGISWGDGFPSAAATTTAGTVVAVDLDFAAVALDSTGLIMDACFFNNPCPFGGALRHGGDVRGEDAVSHHNNGGGGAVGERIDVDLSLLPPHTYAVAFIAMCAGDGDFGPCESAQMFCVAPVAAAAVDGAGNVGGPYAAPAPETSLMNPIALGTAAAQKATVVVLAVARRTSADKSLLPSFSFQPCLAALPRPARSFMDAYPTLLPLIDIDPVMAQELRNRQPSFNLAKGESVRLPVGMTEVVFGLGWDSRCDVDASCIGLGPEGVEKFNVYFGNKNYANGVVAHGGDNLTGEGEGDDEQIVVRLAAMPLSVTALFFTVNVYTSGKDFTDVDGEFCRLFDATPNSANHGREICRYNSLDSGSYNGIVIAALFRNPHFPQQWEFEATALPGMGNTSACLIGECRALQRSKVSGEPLREAYEARRRAACKSRSGCCVVQ